MINIKYTGIEPSGEYDEKIKSSAVPNFASYKEDISQVKTAVEPFQKYPKILVIGNGGSISTFAVYLRALKGNGKKVFILNTNDPDLIANLKKDYTPDNTAVVCVSKSGSTISGLEAVLQFTDYQTIVVTEKPEDNPLRKLAQHYKWTVIDHPLVGGRFSGFTSAAFVPAVLFGLPLENIQSGASEIYAKCSQSQTKPLDNPAWVVASILNRAKLVGKDEIFMPVYSYYLETSIPLVTQLFHETLAKNGKGFTVLSSLAPESQHHTNQRFFGGKKNMIGVFISVKNFRDETTKTQIADEIKDTKLRDGVIGELDGLTLAQSLRFEAEATRQDAEEQKIPTLTIELDKIDSAHIAGYIALMQMVVYFLAIFEGVDPFDQPQVERSKEISWLLRKHK